MSLIGSSDLIGKAAGGRKLIAVVYADMVGYSRLIGLDDLGTLERLRTLRRMLIDPAISEHGGRIVQTGGDSLLIVFDSIDGAVRCAVNIQQRMPDYDGDQLPDRLVRFRIGINIGDVIADGTDLHGEGVNVAARLQAECPPGGICVSRAVRDHVHTRLDLVFDELGTLSLKNIARPIETFVLRLGAEAIEPFQLSSSRLALPDKPSIAVLPFDNMSSDAEQEYFADGITEDIITALSKWRSFFVIARNSSFAYKGRAVDVTRIGRELGVRYILEGSVRKIGTRVRIMAQLVGAATGSHLWADHFDRELADVFDAQDEVTRSIVAAIETAAGNRSGSFAMRATIRDRLSLNARAHLTGRATELAVLHQALVQGVPVVIYLHGIPGIGKSALAMAFAEDVRSLGGAALTVECAAVEPTERGLLRELGRLLDCDRRLDDIAVALGAQPSPVLLLFDGYEVFGLLDAWMRQILIPALPDRVLVLLTSRLPPSDAWAEAPAWQDLFHTMPLGLLPDSDATELLTRLDIPVQDMPRIVAFAAGHPLALTLAARAARLPASERAAMAPTEAAIPQLARRYLAGIPDAGTREVLRSACVARRISRGLLRSLSPEADAEALYAKLAALPFVTPARDGLAVHEAVREALAADLSAADPEMHRRSRQQAWRYLSQEARTAPFGELWRCTADLIHLVRNPVVREAFFPRDARRLTIEPARPDDRQAIFDIAETHDGSAAPIELWWTALPQAFFVARSPDRPVEGFYCLLDAAPALSEGAILQRDPITARFAADLREHPIPGQQTALFLRRWLDRQEGDRASPVQAACWLDVKRHYMERRPRLRRVYLAVEDFAPYAAVAGTLGFVPLPAPVMIGNQTRQTAVLDMGPGSVDGWLLRLAAEELGIPSTTGLLDHAKRALHVDDTLVPLTRREFDVMAYLVAREGDAVSRDSLIQDVWGLRIDPGSNVVDAVIASLRRKLGGRSGAIETARGFGYVYRAGIDPSLPARR